MREVEWGMALQHPGESRRGQEGLQVLNRDFPVERMWWSRRKVWEGRSSRWAVRNWPRSLFPSSWRTCEEVCRVGNGVGVFLSLFFNTLLSFNWQQNNFPQVKSVMSMAVIGKVICLPLSWPWALPFYLIPLSCWRGGVRMAECAADCQPRSTHHKQINNRKL